MALTLAALCLALGHLVSLEHAPELMLGEVSRDRTHLLGRFPAHLRAATGAAGG